MLGNLSKRAGLLLPLLMLTAVNAAPTVNGGDSIFIVSAIFPASDTHIPIEAGDTFATGALNSHLAGAAAEFLKPPTASAPPASARSLPAVPGALLMGLTGFLCVSLVKDRRFWLAAFAGLLWLGQAGIQAVPQLAVRLGHRNHTARQFTPGLNYSYYLENSRLRSDIDGTQYIGLLNHLAGIPDSSMSFLALRKSESSQTEDEFRAPQFAITPLLSHLIPATSCLALRAEQFIYFSPAFIFDNLPRGPPQLT